MNTFAFTFTFALLTISSPLALIHIVIFITVLTRGCLLFDSSWTITTSTRWRGVLAHVTTLVITAIVEIDHALHVAEGLLLLWWIWLRFTIITFLLLLLGVDSLRWQVLLPSPPAVGAAAFSHEHQVVLLLVLINNGWIAWTAWIPNTVAAWLLLVEMLPTTLLLLMRCATGAHSELGGLLEWRLPVASGAVVVGVDAQVRLPGVLSCEGVEHTFIVLTVVFINLHLGHWVLDELELLVPHAVQSLPLLALLEQVLHNLLLVILRQHWVPQTWRVVAIFTYYTSFDLLNLAI